MNSSTVLSGFIEAGIRHYKVSDLPAEELVYFNPFNPTPSDGAIGIPLDENLGWSCYGSDSGSLTYDIYFGTNRNPPLVKSNHKSTSYEPGTLKPDTNYYWQVVVKDGGYAVKGGVWRFKTEKKPISESVSKDKESRETCKGVEETTINSTVYDTEIPLGLSRCRNSRIFNEATREHGISRKRISK